jgi:hypothetical protein
MKKITVFLMAVFCLGMIGCSKDAEVEAFIKDFDAVSKEMAAKIDGNPTVAGIDDAQKAFDAKKGALKEKFATFKTAREAQVSKETLKKLTDSITNNGKAISEAFGKHAMDYADEPEAGPKFQKLMKDYVDTFQM